MSKSQFMLELINNAVIPETIREISIKVLNGERIDFQEGVSLYREAELPLLACWPTS
jgi:hypothetical protein